MVWGEAEDHVVQLMRVHAAEDDIAKAVNNVEDVNVFHQWRDVRYVLNTYRSGVLKTCKLMLVIFRTMNYIFRKEKNNSHPYS
jgi:hypothetical protein